MSHGTNGTILRVDLTGGSISTETFDEAFYRRYPGGKALAAYHLLREFRPGGDSSIMLFADQDLAFYIYYEDEPAAVCVIFPDMNPLLKRLNGRIGLTGVLKFLMHRHEIRGLRCLMFGVKEKYRQLGIPYASLSPHI